MTTYLSLFSGAGGFEHPQLSPVLVCESDPACERVLKRRIPSAPLHSDVLTLKNETPRAEFVVGGWPCQDISSAGNMIGLGGSRSGLFFDMLTTAQRAKAHTIVGENVPYLLSVNKGRDFERLISVLTDAGYPFVSWRILNARQFGLPQERNRVFIVASKHREHALALHAAQPEPCRLAIHPAPLAAGFYWTAGGRSICYSVGYTPALKIGASDGKGRSVVAVFRDGLVRKVSANACARLQGFDPADFSGESKTDIVRMAGNAVPVPMGSFVLESVFASAAGQTRFLGTGTPLGYGRFADAGLFEDGAVWAVENLRGLLATNLDEFIAEDSGECLSGQAAAGLIVRTIRAGKTLPPKLFDVLLNMSRERTSYRGSRSNSFNELDRIDVARYRRNLEQGLVGLRQRKAEEEHQGCLFAN
jgi:DNA (cytosine-5)-methyltransferase 1